MFSAILISGLFCLFLTAAVYVSFSRVMILLDVVFVGHDLSTTKKAARKAGEILRLYEKHHGLVYDLGSCRGDFLINLSGYCKLIKPRGVDNSNFRVKLSSVKSFLRNSSAKFTKGDLLDANISSADAIYLYLSPAAMPELEIKMQKELKPGALVITNTQFFPNWQPLKIFTTHPNNPEFEKMFVYLKS